jgi:hypothetical protein
MFSPTLLTAIIHGLWRESWSSLGPQGEIGFTQLVDQLQSGLARLDGMPGTHLPVVVRATGPAMYGIHELGDIDAGEVAGDPSAYFWGRVRLDRLVDAFSRDEQRLDVRGAQYFDLGTQFRSSSGAQFDADAICTSLIPQTNASPSPSGVTIAFVDRGVEAPGQFAETFGGNLHQVFAPDVTMSVHAKTVLAVILDQCQQLGILSDVHVACALAKPAPGLLRTGLTCLEQDNAPEILAAVKALSLYVSGPASINLSMGTHVGPHDGQTPLESFVAGFTSPTSLTFMHVAAGNDGQAGYHATVDLQPGVGDDLVLHTGPSGAEELLVELWWDEGSAPAGRFDIEIEVVDAKGVALFSRNVALSTPGRVYALSAPRGPHDRRQSLVASQCLGGMSCAGFGLSAPNPADLADLELRFTLICSTDLIVHAWVVGSTDSRTAFVGSTRDETLVVPATARDVVAVAGMETKGRVWPHSSRGPSASYRGGLAGDQAPHVAHGARAGSDCGSSFASARTAAETAARLLDPVVRARCTGRDALVTELLKISALGIWSRRTGYGSVL